MRNFMIALMIIGALLCSCGGGEMPLPPDHQYVSAADAGPGAPFDQVECPSDDAAAAAADVRRVCAVCLANHKFLQDLVTDGTGAIIVDSVETNELLVHDDADIIGSLGIGVNLSVSGIIAGATIRFTIDNEVRRGDWQYVASSVFGGTAFEADYVPEVLIGWDANSGHEIPCASFRPRNPATPSGDPIYSKFALIAPVPGWELESVEVVSEGNGTFTGSDTRPTFEIGRWDGASIWDPLSSVTNDAHLADGSNWSTRLITTVTATPSTIVNPMYRYGVKVKHPRAAGSFGYRVLGFKAKYVGKALGK